MLTLATQLYKGFYIEKPVGNNAFSYDERENKRIYVAPLKAGDLDDLEEGEEVAFSEILEDKEVNRKGLKNFIYLSRTHQKVFIFDNHNHAFFFWMYAVKEGFIKPGLTLVHIDQHKDLREPSQYCNLLDFTAVNLNKALQYTNFELNVGNFIKPALNMHLFSDIIIMDSKRSLEAHVGGNYVLDIDMDIFSKDMEYIDYDFKFNKIKALLKKARLVTIATSPYFMEQQDAIRIIKELLS